jgi:hypothetical protein
VPRRTAREPVALQHDDVGPALVGEVVGDRAPITPPPMTTTRARSGSAGSGSPAQPSGRARTCGHGRSGSAWPQRAAKRSLLASPPQVGPRHVEHDAEPGRHGAASGERA